MTGPFANGIADRFFLWDPLEAFMGCRYTLSPVIRSIQFQTKSSSLHSDILVHQILAHSGSRSAPKFKECLVYALAESDCCCLNSGGPRNCTDHGWRNVGRHR